MMLRLIRIVVVAVLLCPGFGCVAAEEDVVVNFVGRTRVPLTKVDLMYSTPSKLNFFRISAETDITSTELRSLTFAIGSNVYSVEKDVLSRIKYPRLKDILFSQNSEDVESSNWRSEVIIYFNAVEDYSGDEFDSSFVDIALNLDGIAEIFIYNSITNEEFVVPMGR